MGYCSVDISIAFLLVYQGFYHEGRHVGKDFTPQLSFVSGVVQAVQIDPDAEAGETDSKSVAAALCGGPPKADKPFDF